MNLCKYSNIFGKPNEGPHSTRIFGFALFDILLVLIIGYFISIKFKYKYLDTILVLFLLGIVVHELFCVKTKLNTLLFN
jgi:hypothetical protein